MATFHDAPVVSTQCTNEALCSVTVPIGVAGPANLWQHLYACLCRPAHSTLVPRWSSRGAFIHVLAIQLTAAE